MTEYEVFDLIDGVFGNMWAVSQFGFGLISAYCLLAYYIGAKLSFFQVAFVNICFFVMNMVTNLSMLNGFRRLNFLSDSLSGMATEAIPIIKLPATAVLAFYALLLNGCYALMWSIRHPKAE